VQDGTVELLGIDVRRRPEIVRKQIGVTFQSPSLDTRLSVKENLRHHGHLYGFSGKELTRRIGETLEHLNLKDRENAIVSTLSGGLKRRVEIGKGLLHDPRLLLLDEPSTGLDPGARIDLWEYLTRLKSQKGMTVLVTTHLMDEAERANQLGILDRGRLVALDSPELLRASVGGDCLTIQCSVPPARLAEKIQAQFPVTMQQVGESLRIEREKGHELLKELVEAFPNEITGISLGKPTLEDVFIKRTGHEFWIKSP
jgi:ABC-2 type transport system ATP-binding protein